MIEKLEAIEICFGLFLLYSGIEGRYYLKITNGLSKIANMYKGISLLLLG